MARFLVWTLCFYIFDIRNAYGRIFSNTFAPTSSIFRRFTPEVKYKTCLLKPQEGPCRSKIRMYYFDPVNQACSTFRWGGCQGNGNRFDTEEQCMDRCLTKAGDKKKIPNFCSLRFDYGFCFGEVTRYYYDSLWKVCKQTIYSGCGGNKNNFYNREQCENICRFGKGPIGGGKKNGKTDSGSKVIIINPSSATQTTTDKSKITGTQTTCEDEIL